MPRKTIQSEILQIIYFESAIELMSIDSSNESEAEEAKDIQLMDILAVIVMETYFCLHSDFIYLDRKI